MARKLKVVEPVDAFTAAIREYPDEMLMCRDLGHHWRPVTASRESNGMIHRTMLCANCKSHRYQVLDRSGYIVSSSYSYEPGYVVPGTGRWTGDHRAAMRLASVDRQV
jgi:hypothetical protein